MTAEDDSKEVKLHAARERALMRAPSSVIVILNSEGRLIHGATSLGHFCRIDPQKLREGSWIKIMAKADQDEFLRTFEDCQRKRVSFEFEGKLISGDDDTINASFRAEPVFHENQVVREWVVAIDDLGPSVERLSLQNRLAGIVEGSQDAIIGATLDGRILDWNRGAKLIYGFSQDEMKGETTDRLVPKDLREGLSSSYAKVSRGEKVSLAETERLTKDGRRITVSESLSPIYDFKNRIVGVSHISRDVTELKRLMGDVEKARREAERANEAKSLFLANISHEIRTPLGSIVGFSDLVLSTDVSETERNDYIRRIRNNAEHLSRMIEDLMDLTKIEAQKMEVDAHLFNPQKVFAQIGSMFSLKAREKGLEFWMRAKTGFPKNIYNDSTRIKQVITNLLSNAVKFTNEGQIDLEYGVRQNDGESQFFITVADTGAGINSLNTDSLFHAYSQFSEKTSLRQLGSGLGLHLSRRLARLLGGDVRLMKSTVDGGSTFEFYFRLSPEEMLHLNEPAADAQETPPIDLDIEELADSLRSVRAIIVEDSYDNGLYLQRLLEHAGASADIVGNGPDAIEVLTNGSEFDVVLMDLQLPEMSGYEVIRELRRSNVTLPAIAISAHAMKGEYRTCEEAGFDDFLAKPVQAERLVQSIKAYVYGEEPRFFSSGS